MNYATLNDVIALWRPLTADEASKVEELLTIVSSELRMAAKRVGKDLDDLVETDPDMKQVAKSVTVDIIKRYVTDSAADGVSMTQISQSAGGYSVSGTYANPGGGIFIKRAELARLGLRVQRFGVIDLA